MYRCVIWFRVKEFDILLYTGVICNIVNRHCIMFVVYRLCKGKVIPITGPVWPRGWVEV